MKLPFRVSRVLAASAALAAFGCAQVSQAAHYVDVAVVDRSTGERLATYRHGGRLYVAGTPGNRYGIELRSRSGERMLAVVSVDGVNALTGQTAATLQSGYVIDGWQSWSINGWRKSLDDVAQFVFTALPDSYAARTGRPGNVGVIGVAVFREKPPQPIAMAPASAPAPAAHQKAAAESTAGALADSAKASDGVARAERADADMRAKKLGTGHGEREHSPTRYTEFARNADVPDEVVTIYYDSRPSLVARGIIPSPRASEPLPFPAGAGFVPDPRG